jgi:hypothetical protein
MKLSKLSTIFSVNDENKTRLIGLLTILITCWLVLYFIPEVFVSLFNTLLGNLILIITILLVYINNRIYGLVLGFICLLLFRFSQLSKQREGSKEGFTQDSITDFINVQNTIHRQKVFDMNVIGTQASQEELDYFNETGMWPWSQKVIDLYQAAITRNPYIRTLPEQATNEARTIYNEDAIQRILSYQTKEGQFLLNGVAVTTSDKNNDLPSGFGLFGYSSGLTEDKSKDTIICNLKDDSNPTIERIQYKRNYGMFGQQSKQTTPVNYTDLEKVIPGFTFLKSPCNPCKAMSSTPDYSCPFSLQLKDDSSVISDIWQKLWGLN